MARQTFGPKQLLRLGLNLQVQLSEHVSDVEFAVTNDADVAMRLLLVLGRRQRLAAAMRTSWVLPRLRSTLATVVLSAEVTALSLLVVLEYFATATAVGRGVDLLRGLGSCDEEDLVIMLVIK